MNNKYIYNFLLAVFACSLLCAQPFAYEATSSTSSWTAQNDEYIFYKPFDDIAYRQYPALFDGGQGSYAFLVALLHTALAQHVSAEVAYEVGGFSSSPWLRAGITLLSSLTTPMALRELTSWFVGKKLGREQIQIESELLRQLFYIEIIYDEQSDREIIQILPVPVPDTVLQTQARTPDIRLWLKLYQRMQQLRLTTLQLSWDTHHQNIIVATESSDGSTVSLIQTSGFEDHAEPIEPFLHKVWASSLCEGINCQKVSSLLHGEVIQKTTLLLDLADSPTFFLPPALFSGELTTDSASSEFYYTLPLCEYSHKDQCSHQLVLVWEQLPFPKYRPKLIFSDSHSDYPKSIAESFYLQLADTNKSEKLLSLFEMLLLAVPSFFINRHWDYLRQYPTTTYPETAVVRAVEAEQMHLIPTLTRSFTDAHWQSVFLYLCQLDQPAYMILSSYLSDTDFNWLEYITRISGERSSAELEKDLETTFQVIWPSDQVGVVNHFLESKISIREKVLSATPLHHLYQSQSDQLPDYLLTLTDTEWRDHIEFLSSTLPYYPSLAQRLAYLSNVLPWEKFTLVVEETESKGAILKKRIVKGLLREDMMELTHQLFSYPTHLEAVVEGTLDFLGSVRTELDQEYFQKLEFFFGVDFVKSIIPRLHSHHFNRPGVYLALAAYSKHLLEAHDDADWLFNTVLQMLDNHYPPAVRAILYETGLASRVIRHFLEKDGSQLADFLEHHTELAIEYILKGPLQSPEEIDRLLSNAEPGMLLASTENRLNRHKDSATFLLNAMPESAAVNIVFDWLQTERRHDNFHQVPLKLLKPSFERVISSECFKCLDNMMSWVLSYSDNPTARTQLNSLTLSEENLRWLFSHLSILISGGDLSPGQVSSVLPMLPRPESIENMQALVTKLPAPLSTELAFQYVSSPDESVKVVSSMNSMQASHYLARLTHFEELWQQYQGAVALASRKAVTDWDYFLASSPKIERLETILMQGCSGPPSSSLSIVSVAEELTCSICQEVFNKPVTESCGHSFCKDCIDTWAEKQPHCPLCKAQLQENEPPINFVIERMVDRFQLRAPATQ